MAVSLVLIRPRSDQRRSRLVRGGLCMTQLMASAEMEICGRSHQSCCWATGSFAASLNSVSRVRTCPMAKTMGQNTTFFLPDPFPLATNTPRDSFLIKGTHHIVLLGHALDDVDGVDRKRMLCCHPIPILLLIRKIK